MHVHVLAFARVLAFACAFECLHVRARAIAHAVLAFLLVLTVLHRFHRTWHQVRLSGHL